MVSALSDLVGGWIDTPSILIFLFVLLIVRCMTSTYPPNLPPGPSTLASIWSSVNFRERKVDDMRKLVDQYGGVISVYFGQLCIFLSGYQIFREAFVEKAHIFTDRPSYPLLEKLGNGLGLVNSSGHMWKQQRRFLLQTLKYFGVGKKKLEDSILKEASYLCKALQNKQGLPTDPHGPITKAVANVICTLVFGHRFEYDDQDFHLILQCSNDVFHLPATVSGQLYNMFPRIVSKLPGWHQTVLKRMGKLRQFVLDEIRTHKEKRSPDNPQDYIDSYLDEIEKCPDEQAGFTEENLFHCVLDLFGAGTETSAGMLTWALLYMAKNPAVQERVQAELDQVIGHRSRPTAMDDRADLPYTYAVVHEIQRFASIVLMTPPRVANQDTSIGGYFIPKGTLMAPIIHLLMYDEDVYATPQQFNPGHFLNEDGQFVKDEKFVPFSIGKRKCPGEQLAQMELFLFFTSLMQRFSFRAPKGEALGLEKKFGITLIPKPFKIHAVPR